MIDELAFLPLDDVNEGIKVLRSITPPNEQELIAYFDVTYVTGRVSGYC